MHAHQRGLILEGMLASHTQRCSMPDILACNGQAPSRLFEESLCHLCRQLLTAAEAHAAIWWLLLQAVAKPACLSILSNAAIAASTAGLPLTCCRTICIWS
ncbi:hypothetical protein CVIRNUC_007390 [Coccomyxa viridis]|uniref:Uncharacterized protein n=1 Tax=Coccomyxa viridis TaxID=1274662 RepID=A0AAV1I9Y9_9CHLO|nr:hypothetical protein CVIRNUC_007390 [Coccomyxa viridis]